MRRNRQPSFSRRERAARRRGGCRGVYLFDSVRVLHASTFSDIHLCRVHTSRLEKREQITHLRWFPQSLGALVGRRRGGACGRLTTGLWTSQKALSWLSRIFLSVLSFFLSILQVR